MPSNECSGEGLDDVADTCIDPPTRILEVVSRALLPWKQGARLAGTTLLLRLAEPAANGGGPDASFTQTAALMLSTDLERPRCDGSAAALIRQEYS
jgi:hypothetical protein